MVVLCIGYLFLYIYYVWVIIPLRCCYILICIYMFVNVISIFTEICWCSSYNVILGCTTSWEYCHAYVLYILCYPIFFVLVDLHSQKCIDISLFELVVTCIETHIFVPSLSISRVFISIIKNLCFLLLLGKLFALNIQHSKICNQYHLYTIFEQIPSFPCFFLSYTQIQCVSLTNREGVLYSICQIKRMS